MTGLATPHTSFEPPSESVHVFPTSPQQQRFWLLDQIDGERASYTIPVALRVDGALDVDCLVRAFAIVVERHEALRTVFAMEPDGPVQVVRSSPRPTLAVEDLSALDGAHADDAALRLAEDEANTPFDLSTGPLVRARLLQLGAERHVLLLTLHHSVADGTSLGVLFGELDAAYSALIDGREPALPALPLQYADYAVWQRRALEGRAATRQLDHWATRLAGVPPLELPTDRPRPAIQSVAGMKRERRISTETAEAVRALARAHGVTPYVACLAAYVALLHRYSAQSDFAVGAITSGRTRAELEPLIGPFVNTLALRVAPDPARPFSELLAQVRDVVADGMANGAVPFEQVVERVQPVRDRSRSPLFQAAFQLLDGVTGEPRLGNLRVAPLGAAKQTAKFDITLIVRSAPDGGLVAVAEYATALFDDATVDGMLSHYATLLAAAARDASVAVGRLPMLGDDERAMVMERWNATAQPLPTWTVASRVLDQAAGTPDVVAVRTSDEVLTYRELARRSAVVARRLVALGVTPGDRVAVCVDRTTTLPVALLGVLRTGAAYVPIDPSYPAERIAQVLEDADVAVVLTDDASRRSLPAVIASIESLGAATWAAEVSDDECFASPVLDGEALAYVLFTSGSTGRPKGVMIPHRALSNFLESMLEAPGLAAGDALVAVTTVSFDIAGLELWLPLVTGAEVVFASRETAQDGRKLRDVVERTTRAVGAHRVMLQATPATWRLLIEAGWMGAPNVTVLCGGEAWPAGLAAALRARGGALWNVYGPTETTIWSARAQITSDDVSLGEPLANTTLHVLEPSGEPAALGMPGELWIGGAGLALGYLGRDDLTAERFVVHERLGRLYRTGDRVRRAASGRLEYLGRLDDQVKVRGFRIELGEIESVLASHPAVRGAAAAVFRGAEQVDARLAAYVVLAPDADARTVVSELDARLRRALPEYMVPSAIAPIDALPLTPNGKVNRRALPVPDAAAEARVAYVEPRTELESLIADAWRAVLGVERVGIDDDFFALGGHSLAAMRVIARLSERIAVPASIGALFEAHTVASFAARIERTEGSATAPARIASERDTGPAPLSAAQERIWLHEQMLPDSGAYNLPMSRRLRGLADVFALERALSAVVQRHEALRTRIVERDGVPVQLADAPPPRLDVQDLRAAPNARRVAEADRLACETASSPFDLAGGPPIRARLVLITDNESLLTVVVHHVVFDGGSIAIFWRDLDAAYASARRGQEFAASPPPVQMADVASWERATVSAESVAAATAYWRHQLEGGPSAVELPLDRPRGGATSGPAAQVSRMIAAELARAVASHAAAREATPFLVWLAALEVLLHRASLQDDVVVGSPFMTRRHADTQQVIGHLASTLVLRGRFDDDPTFDTLLARARRDHLAALEHQDVAFERVAGALRAAGGGAPGFNVAFVMQEGHVGSGMLGDLSVEPHAVSGTTAKFDLTVSLHATTTGARVTLEYRADLFEPATAEALLERYERLLFALLAASASPVSRVPLLGAEEQRRILDSWRGRAVAYPRDATIHELVAEQARRTPDSIAIVDGDHSLSYAVLDARANQLANLLRTLGVARDVRVAMCVRRSADMVVAALGILKAGGAYVPLDPSYPAVRLALMLADARPRVVITDCALLDRLPLDTASAPEAPTVLRIDADWPSIAAELATAPPPDAEATSLAYVIYTSGSTGTPKGVAAVHRGVVRLVANADYVRLGPDETLLSFAPLAFDASTLELWGALCTGGRLVIFPGDAPSLEELGDVIARHGVTTVWLTAALFHQFVDANLEGLRPLRQLLAGGDALSMSHVRRVLDAMPQCTLINGYGPTENTTFTCCHPMRGPVELGASVPIGRPIGNTTVYILDRWMQPVPTGFPGRLYTGGDGLARGYLGRPELTAERFFADPFDDAPDARVYDTGDLARWRADGTIEFLGRADTQLKIRGFRIEPGEVEAALLAEPEVREAVVVGREDGRGGKRLVAYIVAAPGARIDGLALRLRIAARLPEYLVPALVMTLDALPLTASGKVDRRALPEPTASSATVAAPPRDDVERVVTGAWGDALGRVPDSVEASFFDLGGDSLLAIRVVAHLFKIFRVKLPLRRFFDQPTVAGVARALVAEEGKEGQTAAIAAKLLRIQSMSPEERERLRRATVRSNTQT